MGGKQGLSQAVLLAYGGLGDESKDPDRHLLFSRCSLVLQRPGVEGRG